MRFAGHKNVSDDELMKVLKRKKGPGEHAADLAHMGTLGAYLSYVIKSKRAGRTGQELVDAQGELKKWQELDPSKHKVEGMRKALATAKQEKLNAFPKYIGDLQSKKLQREYKVGKTFVMKHPKKLMAAMLGTGLLSGILEHRNNKKFLSDLRKKK